MNSQGSKSLTPAKSLASALLLSASLLAVSMAEATTIFVQSPTTEGGTDEQSVEIRSSLRALIKAAVSLEPGYSLASSSTEAEFQLQPRLLKLGSSYIVSVDKTKGDKLTYTAKLKASSAEDIDSVSTRVVRAVLKETKVEDSAQVGDIVESEIHQNTKRIQTTRQWKLGFGPAWGLSMNTDQSGLGFLLGFVWGIDPNFDLDLTFRTAGFEKSKESGAHFTDFMIGTNYYLTRDRNALYLTGAVGRSWASASITDSNTLLNTSDDNANGWGARVGVGYKFFRTSTVNLGLEVNYSQLFGETSRSKGRPGLTGATLSLYY